MNYKHVSLISALLLLGVPSLPAQTKQTDRTASPPVAVQLPAQPAPEFSLIELPYPAAALAPAISETTILLHHGKHLQGYVNNLNRLKRGTVFEYEPSLERIVRESKGTLFDNAGQVLNHNLYFTQFSPSGHAPSGEILRRIEARWGSLEAFQGAFEAEGAKLFGSGWLWLVEEPGGTLAIVREPNGSNPMAHGLTPLLGFDLWEHAYYLDYQNRRPDHIRALWGIVDWRVVGSRLRP